MIDPMTLSIASVWPRVGVCDLCSVGPEALRGAVLVRHVRGGSVQLAACDRCATGIRRLIAVAGGATPAGPAHVIVRPELSARIERQAAISSSVEREREVAISASPERATVSSERETPVAVGIERDASVADLIGSPLLIQEFAEPIRAEDGLLYTVRVHGQERADGTWVGWLTFVGSDGDTIRRTGRETTQSNQEHVAYWATGLQPSYVEGAFRRANLA